jgi:hypothetical protein
MMRFYEKGSKYTQLKDVFSSFFIIFHEKPVQYLNMWGSFSRKSGTLRRGGGAGV